MTQHALYVELHAQPGKEEELAAFLASAKPLVDAEPGTTAWFGVRFDARDHVLREVLVGDEHLVNDILVTLGVSVFFPFGG